MNGYGMRLVRLWRGVCSDDWTGEQVQVTRSLLGCVYRCFFLFVIE